MNPRSSWVSRALRCPVGLLRFEAGPAGPSKMNTESTPFLRRAHSLKNSVRKAAWLEAKLMSAPPPQQVKDENRSRSNDSNVHLAYALISLYQPDWSIHP